jgi:hypothetical protein
MSVSSIIPATNQAEENVVAVTDVSFFSNQQTQTHTDPISVEIPQEGRYDVMLDSISGPITYYNQADSRWRNFLYGGKDRLSKYGCGPTVMAMLVTSLTGRQVLPTDMASWAAANKCWAPGQGSYHRIVKDSAAAYGLKAASLNSYTVKGLKDALDSGHLIVALMKKGHFTNQGHFIIITRMSDAGKLHIADCNNYSNTKKEWDPSIILNELNYHSRNGGPLWMIRVSQSE